MLRPQGVQFCKSLHRHHQFNVTLRSQQGAFYRHSAQVIDLRGLFNPSDFSPLRRPSTCATVFLEMAKPNKAQKESFILIAAVTLMTLKIMLGIVLMHRWRLKAAREGLPFVEDDDS